MPGFSSGGERPPARPEVASPTLPAAMTSGQPGWSGTRALLSSALVFAAYHGLFVVFHRYDWDQAVVKLVCFEALFAMILVPLLLRSRRPAAGRTPAWALVAELAVAGALVAWELARAVGLIEIGLRTAPNDLGQTTEDAVRMAFIAHQNPYQHAIAAIGDDPAFHGYKYGPSMLLGYWPAALWPHSVGLKVANAVYLALMVGMVAALAGRARSGTGAGAGSQRGLSTARLRLPAAAAAAWVAALTLLPERLYHEVFNQGAPDPFPILLIVASIFFVDRQRWLLAGLAAGLSFSAKFAPAVFLLVLLGRRRIPPSLVAGVALGMLPFLPFVLWDAGALWRNVFLFHTFKTFDRTSLYSVTPPQLHFLFSLFQLAAVALAWAVNFRRPILPRSLTLTFVLLLIAIEISYREVHGNHLIWFIPTVALALAWSRHEWARLWPR